MEQAGFVLVLDGPSCVGRSTTLAALQRAWPEVRTGPLLEAGLDAALHAFGPAGRLWRELVLPTVATVSGQHVGWGPLGRELIGGMHRAAAAWARGGMDVAIDHVLLDRLTVRDLTSQLAGLELLHVGLVCDETVLEERERALGRGTGVAVAQARAGADVAVRDLVLDTTEATTDELVAAILREVAARS